MSKKEYKLKRKKVTNKEIYLLSEKDKIIMKNEETFKNIFRLKLKKWHDLLSGTGTTGDPALDDILNIMLYCYLQDKIKLFELDNIKYYDNDNNYKKNLKYLYVDELLKDTQLLRPANDFESSIILLGELLVLHPKTSSVIKRVDFLNCKKPVVINQLIREILDFTKNYNIFKKQDLIGNCCEYWINDYKGNQGKDLGSYFTERKLMKMCLELIDIEDIKRLKINNNSVIGDEFCGTYGFPLYLRGFLRDKFNIKIKDKNMCGIEFEERLARYAILNSMFSMKDFSNIKEADSFYTDLTPHLDISVHNVPFGKRMRVELIEEDYNNIKTDKMPNFNKLVPIKKNTDACLAAQVVFYKTKKMGICILPDGVEIHGKALTNFRKYFCENSVVKKILRIPEGCFVSTNTKTICIYFLKEKNKKTQNIQFLQLNQECSKISEICNISLEDLKHNNYCWNYLDYIVDERIEEIKNKSNCTFMKLGQITSLINGEKVNSKLGLDEGEYPLYYCSIKGHKYYNDFTYDGEGIIINKTNGSGKCAVYYAIGKYNVGNTTIHFRSNNNNILTKYIYYFLKNNISILENYFVGSAQKSIPIDKFNSIQIPIHKIEEQRRIIRILDDLSNQKKLLNQRIKGINNQKNYYFENKMSNIDITIKKLGEFVKIKTGKDITKKNREKGVYPYYGANGVMDYVKDFLFDGKFLLTARTGSLGSLHITDGKFSCSGDVHRIEFKDELILKFTYYYLRTIDFKKYNTGSSHPKLNGNKLKSIEIPIPNKEVMTEIVINLDKLEENEKLYNNDIIDIDDLIKSIIDKSFNIKKKKSKKNIISV